MPSPGRRKTSAREMNVMLRRQYVFSLRCTGASYSVIYDAVQRRFGTTLPKSYNRRRVHEDVLDELALHKQDLAHDVEVVRQLELQRLDQLQLAIWSLALGRQADLERGLPAQPPDLEAQRQLLAIQARRAKYLPGLEVPARIAPTTPAGDAPYQPGPAAGPSEHFFAELTTLFQQLGPQHGNGYASPRSDPDTD